MREFGEWISDNVPWLMVVFLALFLGVVVFAAEHVDNQERLSCWEHRCRDGNLPEWFHDRCVCVETPAQ